MQDENSLQLTLFLRQFDCLQGRDDTAAAAADEQAASGSEAASEKQEVEKPEESESDG